jgi:hypothetical protein
MSRTASGPIQLLDVLASLPGRLGPESRPPGDQPNWSGGRHGHHRGITPSSIRTSSTHGTPGRRIDRINRYQRSSVTSMSDGKGRPVPESPGWCRTTLARGTGVPDASSEDGSPRRAAPGSYVALRRAALAPMTQDRCEPRNASRSVRLLDSNRRSLHGSSIGKMDCARGGVMRIVGLSLCLGLLTLLLACGDSGPVAPLLPEDRILWDRLTGTVVVEEVAGSEGLYVLEVSSRTATLVASGLLGVPTSLAPDGSAVAYSHLIFGTDSLWDIRSLPVGSQPLDCRSDSACGEPLHAGLGWQYGLVWSSSGRGAFIADTPVFGDPGNRFGVVVEGTPAHADTLVADPFTQLSWTTAGHLYAALRRRDPETGALDEPRLVRLDPETGTAEVVAGSFGLPDLAVVSPDGTLVAYLSASGTRIEVAPVGGGPPVDLGEGRPPIVWSRDSRSVLYGGVTSGPDEPLEVSTVLASVDGGGRVVVVEGAAPVDWR